MTTTASIRPAPAPRRRPWRRTRAGIVLRLAVLSAVVSAVAWIGVPAAFGQEPYPWPEVRTTEPVEKPFTVVQHYHYREQRYDPPVQVPVLDEPPVSYNAPEEALSGLISAMEHRDHEWWLETWDETSRELIARRDEALGTTPEERLATWEEKARGDAVLVRWVETGQYVILTYRRRGAQDSAESSAEEQRVAMKLSESGWVATLDLAQDPVFQHVTTDEQRIERRVR
ncbi:MAG: hypothetical protein PVG07_04400 [Acidobacteriota bacterium]|jgi:hypothetical protein